MSRIPLDLFQHNESDKAVLLSHDGNPAHAKWIPRSLINEPPALKIVRQAGQHPIGLGMFEIERWKASEAGFIDVLPSQQQGSLFEANGVDVIESADEAEVGEGA